MAGCLVEEEALGINAILTGAKHGWCPVLQQEEGAAGASLA